MEREDKISTLPDGVLCHILSFLPTHNSITTSCLSKRWLPLWHFVLVIDIHLDDETYLRSGCTYSHFLNFAYAILLSQNTKEPLMLACLLVNTRVGPHYDFPEAHFNIWVKAILERGIKHLHLEMPLLLSLTNNVFSCRTLIVLKLRLVGVNILQSVDLPMLKTLHLDYVRMRKIGYVSRILHGCPTMEELRVNHVNLGMIGEHQNMPELIRADIGTNFGIDFPLNVVSNVRILKFFLKFNHQHGFPVFSNLIHLELNFANYINWDMVFKLLIHCPNLQTLVLNKSMVTFILEDWASPPVVPNCISSKLNVVFG